MYQDIKERTFNLGLRIINLSQSFPCSNVGNVLGKQILRSGTSIGANIEEAAASYSRNEFIFKTNIALKEARETHYWLRLLQESNLLKPNQLDGLLEETEEIKKILGAIVSKSLGKNKK
jgi:four helix bundle protein